MPGPSLGGGASGEVFRARDQQSGAQVALKLVNPAVFPTPIAIERASRELRQLSRVTSERIARIVDFGKSADGRFFVATELVEGLSLAELVAREGPLPVARARAFVLQIGEALTEAQKAGVIHRDVSPKNVLVASGDRVRVVNFSVPRPVSDKIFGVPEFLSPEQAEGKSVDQRSNIYSLGTILYFLVVGEPPFTGADARAVCELHLKAAVKPPSRRRPGLPPELDRVVLKALEKNSSRRHLTLRQLLSEIDTIAGDGAGGDVARAKTIYAAGAPPAPGASQVAAPRPNPTPAAPVPSAPAPLPPPAGAAIAPPGRITAQAGTLGGGQAPTKTVQTTPSGQPVQPPAAGAPGAGGTPPAPGKGGGFRETLWFKKGEVDQFIAQNVGQQQPGAPGAEAPAEDIRPLEDRYVDDGSVSAEDRQKFSLRAGGPQLGLRASAGPSASVPGERMSEREMMNEIHGGRRVGIWIAIALGVAVLLALGWLVLRSRGSPKAHAPATAPPAVATAPAAAPPAAAPPAPPPPPTSVASAPAAGAKAEPARPDPPRAAGPPPHRAKRKPGELIAQAQRAAQRGQLTEPEGECAVDLLVEARAAGAAPAALRKVEARLVRVLEVKAHRDMKRRNWREAQNSYAGILKLRPHDRPAAVGLREAERKLKR